jgi:hypothetical protein
VRLSRRWSDLSSSTAILIVPGHSAGLWFGRELHGYFSAEQVDASALAISNIERGAGFITGDQTGIGKGRICASIMRYAQQQGKIAIFITKDKPLYADMMRDVSDIGMQRFTPFVTDSGTEIPVAQRGSAENGRGRQAERKKCRR